MCILAITLTRFLPRGYNSHHKCTTRLWLSKKSFVQFRGGQPISQHFCFVQIGQKSGFLNKKRNKTFGLYFLTIKQVRLCARNVHKKFQPIGQLSKRTIGQKRSILDKNDIFLLQNANKSYPLEFFDNQIGSPMCLKHSQ